MSIPNWQARKVTHCHANANGSSWPDPVLIKDKSLPHLVCILMAIKQDARRVVRIDHRVVTRRDKNIRPILDQEHTAADEACVFSKHHHDLLTSWHART